MKKSFAALAIISSFAFAGNALAYGAGDHVLKGGVNISKPSVDGAESLDTAVAFGASYTYMITDNASVEFGATTPAKFESEGLYDVKKSTYTAMINYHFGDANSSIRPYIGAGIAYVNLSGSILPDYEYFKTDVKGGLGGAVQIGMDWQAQNGFIVGVNTKYTLSKYTLENDYVEASDNLGDISAMISVGYKF